MNDLSMGVDYARVMFGENARHVPMFMYVQDAGPGGVSFVGASALPAEVAHPLRYGSRREHQIIVGDMVVRPRTAVATDALQGYGLSALITQGLAADMAEIMAHGEVLVGNGFDRGGRVIP
jgi:hypothetical protein